MSGWNRELLRMLCLLIRPNASGRPSSNFSIWISGYRQSVSNQFECTRTLYGELSMKWFPVPVSIDLEILDRAEQVERLRLSLPDRTTPHPPPARPRPDNDLCGFVTLDVLDNPNARLDSPGTVPVFKCTLLIEPGEWEIIRETLQWAAARGEALAGLVRVEFPKNYAKEEIKNYSEEEIRKMGHDPLWGITFYRFDAVLPLDRNALAGQHDFLFDRNTFPLDSTDG